MLTAPVEYASAVVVLRQSLVEADGHKDGLGVSQMARPKGNVVSLRADEAPRLELDKGVAYVDALNS